MHPTLLRSLKHTTWLAAVLLAACGGGSDPGAGAGFVVTPLAADTGGGVYATARSAPDLVNGWGLAFNEAGFAWVSEAGRAKASLYDRDGQVQPFSVVIDGAVPPTGVVGNADPADFQLGPEGGDGAAAVLFASLAGTISGWAPVGGLTHTVTVVDRRAAGSVYTGLALANHRLYAADFVHARVDVFDAAFAPLASAGGFVDAQLPAGYAPFGIQSIGDRLYVTYAQPDAATHERRGAGLGALDVFDTEGRLLQRLVTPGGALNAPWGVALAPAGFGPFGGALLVGNFGDGRIQAFDAASGAPLGALADGRGQPLVIDGLWGLAFGNGLGGFGTDSLYYAAGPGGETHGDFGRIDAR